MPPIGYDLIRINIISEVKDAATFYSVLADEVTSHNVEHLPIDIADTITETLTNLGLSLDGLRGQGYDGAKSGVPARIRDKQPKVIYTHCAGHSFNLAVLSSCSIPSIKLHRSN